MTQPTKPTQPTQDTQDMPTSTPARTTIQKLREARGWNQMELAYRAGVSLSTISNIEAGQQVPRVTLARHLAEILGVSETTIEWLSYPRRKRKSKATQEPPLEMPAE